MWSEQKRFVAYGTGVNVPVVGAKGYSVTLGGTGIIPTHPIYLSKEKVGLSRFGKTLRIAGIFELPAESAKPDRRRGRQITEDALPYLQDWRPHARDPGVDTWAGLRPATPDSLPLIGELPSHRHLYLATGHGMLGVTLAPATGKAIAELLSASHTPPWLEPFRPDRL